jgi:hypothetical protein
MDDDVVETVSRDIVECMRVWYGALQDLSISLNESDVVLLGEGGISGESEIVAEGIMAVVARNVQQAQPPSVIGYPACGRVSTHLQT